MEVLWRLQAYGNDARWHAKMFRVRGMLCLTSYVRYSEHRNHRTDHSQTLPLCLPQMRRCTAARPRTIKRCVKVWDRMLGTRSYTRGASMWMTFRHQADV